MTIIDPNNDERLEQRMAETFGTHFASLDAAFGGVLVPQLAAQFAVFTVGIMAAINDSRGVEAPVNRALEQLALAAKRLNATPEGEEEQADA